MIVVCGRTQEILDPISPDMWGEGKLREGSRPDLRIGLIEKEPAKESGQKGPANPGVQTSDTMRRVAGNRAVSGGLKEFCVGPGKPDVPVRS